MKNLPLVAIIGRANVGKSTLFNKLIEQQKALISKVPGTTRDLNFGVCEWRGKSFQVVDTGGIFEVKLKTRGATPKKDDSAIEFQTEKKARAILNQADLILFLVDAKAGILKDDRLVAQLLKKTKKPYLLVVNKIDQTNLAAPAEFKKLGLGDSVDIAAASGVGIGDLLDESIKILKPLQQKHKNISQEVSVDLKQPTLHVSIVGKPNVGKSSLLNQILGEDKVIVSPVPHTTREPQDTIITYQNYRIELVDTAGIRRKSKVTAKSLEAAGIQMSIKALKKSNIALFVLDISKNLTAQDAQLAGLIIKSKVSIIFVANKYDLLETNKAATQQLTNYIHRFFPFLTWAPIIFTSAQSGRNCQKILPLILRINQARQQKIDKEKLNKFIHGLMKRMPPPRQPRKFGGKTKSRAFISKVSQVENANRPIFEIQVTNITKIPESYLRFLENNLRDKFKFTGTPIVLRVVRNKKQRLTIRRK